MLTSGLDQQQSGSQQLAFRAPGVCGLQLSQRSEPKVVRAPRVLTTLTFCSSPSPACVSPQADRVWHRAIAETACRYPAHGWLTFAGAVTVAMFRYIWICSVMD
jgi:hypothetical protein